MERGHQDWCVTVDARRLCPLLLHGASNLFKCAGAQLRAMLEAVSYKKEVIFSALEDTTGRNALQVAVAVGKRSCRLRAGHVESPAVQVLLLFQELRYHGYGHFVLMALSEGTCLAVRMCLLCS